MRRVTRILLWIAGAVLALVLAAGIVVETPQFKQWLRGIVVRQADQHLNGTLTIGRLTGNLISGIELDDVAVSMGDERVVAIDSVKASYSIPRLLSGRGVTVDNVVITHPVVDVHRAGNGWQLAHLLKPSGSQSSSSRPIAVSRIAVTDASITIDKAAAPQTVNIPHTIERLDGLMSFAYAPSKTSVDIMHLSASASDPMLDLRQLSANVTVTPDSINIGHLTVRTAETSMQASGAIADYRRTPTLAMQIGLAPLSLPQIRRFVPSVPAMNVAPDIDVTLGGPTTRLATQISMRSTAGDASFKGTVSLGGPDRVYVGEVAVHHLDLAPFLNTPEQKSDISVYAKINLRGPAGFDTLKGSVAADAPLVSTHGYIVEGIHANAKIDGRTINFDTSELAYKSNTTAAGSVVFATDEHPETRFDLRGVVKDVGIAHLPKQIHVPPAETTLTANYHVHVIIPRRPGWHLDGDVALAKSTVAGVTIGDGATASFVFEPNVARYRVDANVLDVNLQTIGRQFAIDALAASRYDTSLNGHVVVRVDGTALNTMTIDASGMLRDSSLFGGRVPQMMFTAALAHNALHVTTNGRLDDIDPAAVASQRAVEGHVSGTVDADLTFDHLSDGVTADSVGGSVTADLTASEIGHAKIDHASIDGDYHAGFADIQTLEVSGNDLVASGNGTIALNTRDQSGFWIHVESPDMGAVASSLGQPQPLSGIGTLDAIVSGNKDAFTVTGTATANGFKYDKYGALSASATFTATVPNLDAQRASVTADTHATFVDLPGLRVNDVTAKTTYENKSLDFDVTATQPERSLTAAGLLLVRPRDNEVRLRALTFETKGLSWSTLSGHDASFTWGAGGLAVNDLVLASGAQQIRANGAFGSHNQTLTITLADVDLGIVDAWLLRPPQLAGTVNAKAEIGGTADALRASAGFTVENGTFRQVPFDWFSGTVRYSPAAVAVDAKLQQNASQWLTAKGELPMSLLRGTRDATDRIDFHVDSSAIDLGIVQGFTAALTNVKGSFQAKLDLTGTASHPQAAGTIAFANGSFKVQPTGVSYSSLDGQIDFDNDRIHINNLYLLDADNQSLSLTGELGVSGLQVSALNLGIDADNFKVLGNEMGDLRLNSSLALTGSLTQPKLEGDLGVATGLVKLDPILAKLGNSGYSTTAAQTTTAGAQRGERQGGFESLAVAVHLTVPDDLVIKADDLQVAGSPIGLGKLNLTLGGNLNLTSMPGMPMTIVGAVNTVRGYYDYQGRRFDILRNGKVHFEGQPIDRLDPALDVTAERVIQAVTARVVVRGHLRMPQIELTSTPPLQQSDILALIIFNQPLNQLGEGQQLSLAQRAGSLAAGAVANQLTGALANSLNLDQFEINLAPETGGTAEVTVGQQLGQNLYVRVQQGIGDNSQTNFVLEYEFTKWLRLQTNVLEGAETEQQLFQRVRSTGADLVFTFQFK